MRNHRWLWSPWIGWLLGLAAAGAGSGCATHLDRLTPVRDQFFQGQLETARETLEKRQKKHPREADVFRLDQAVVELAAGRPDAAEKLLRVSRDRLDHLEQKSLAEGALSFLTDDNARAYAGEDYERVLIRALLSISNLMSDGTDAGAYALQMTEKQAEIAKRLEIPENGDPVLYTQAYKQVALGPYVRAMLAEESPLTLDDAVKARIQVVKFAPDFPQAQGDLQRAQHESPIPPGHGVVYVFTLVGRGPVKEQVNAEATQAALLVADRIVSAVSPRGLPPTIAPVPIPRVTRATNAIRAVSVAVNGQSRGETAAIVEVGVMAALQQQAREPEIIGRAVARRVVKKGVIYGAKELADADPWGASSLALNLVGIAWEATETADLRCWGLLPDTIQVLRIAVPVGEQRLTLQPVGRHGPFGEPVTQTVRVLDGRNSYVLGHFPDRQLIGALLVNPASRIDADAEVNGERTGEPPIETSERAAVIPAVQREDGRAGR